MYKIEYAKSVVKDLKHLPRSVKERALDVVEKLLIANPSAGKPLTGPFKGLWKFRIGDYRIICYRGSRRPPDRQSLSGPPLTLAVLAGSIERARLVIFVLRIRHRKDVYNG